MTTALASSRKAEWLSMPEAFFETDTFGDLKVGEQFIYLPLPGDNDGHGGFKGTHGIFTKTEEEVKETNGIPYAIPHGRAVNNKRGVPSDLPHSMPVIRVA